MPRVTLWPRLVIVGLLHVYQGVVSPWYGPTCRFYPSCSEYALVAVREHGVVRGSWLAGRRLLRCHPWNPGGVDLVPPVAGRSGVAVSPDADNPVDTVGESCSTDHQQLPGRSTTCHSAPSSDRRVA